MAYPKQPEQLKKKGFGLSLDAQTFRQVEALAGGTGKRSEFIRDTLVIGLEQRFGPNWRLLAENRITATESEVAA